MASHCRSMSPFCRALRCTKKISDVDGLHQHAVMPRAFDSSDVTAPGPEFPAARRSPRRGQVMVAQPNGISHAGLSDLGSHLRPGDLVVANNSAHSPAAVDKSRSGQPITVHFATALSRRRRVGPGISRSRAC